MNDRKTSLKLWSGHVNKKNLNDKSRRIADALMEKMTPLIMKNGVQK